MEDIDQSRFALITVLTKAHEERRDEYPESRILVAMSDEGLRGYAVGLLASLEMQERDDSVASQLRSDLRRILNATP